MFEEKCHSYIQQIINVSVYTLIIYKFIFSRAFEACQTKQALRVVIKITSEQYCCRIVQFAFMQEVEFFKNSRYIFPDSRFRQAPASYASTHCSHNGLFVKVGDFEVGIYHRLPSIFSAPLHHEVVIYFLRHDGSDAFNTLVSPSFIGKRTHIALFLHKECNDTFVCVGNGCI